MIIIRNETIPQIYSIKHNLPYWTGKVLPVYIDLQMYIFEHSLMILRTSVIKYSTHFKDNDADNLNPFTPCEVTIEGGNI